MLTTTFTDLVGCKVPIQMAGMGQLATPRLAAAVSNAGGLGMIGLSGFPPEAAVRALDELGRLTSLPAGVNFLMPSLVDDVTGKPEPSLLPSVAEAASRLRVVEFFYGDPDPTFVDTVHEGGALAAWQIGSQREAVAAERAGCDLIVAQGLEAGGHVRGTIGLHALLAQVLPAARVPVVAAGGIGTGSAMAAALAAGASGVRVGTRFVAAEESDAHPSYVTKLIGAEPEDTVLTETFSANWPNAPHRVLRSSVEAAQRFSGDVVGERVYAWDPDTRVPVARFTSLVPMKSCSGEIDAMPHWAGESVVGVTAVMSAADIVRELAGEAERLLRGPRLSGRRAARTRRA
jgi:NAD(P)H-dependent flavin oxidoreductase YrpB (nitropropane dioxygenase family)